LLLLSAWSSGLLAEEHDVLIRHGRVPDGSSADAVRRDLAITGDRMVALGDLQKDKAKRVIDASGLHVTPGFIHSMSGLAAEVCHIGDRGFIGVGAFADILVFDPLEVKDRATFEQPQQLSVGMEWVFVNGITAISNGEPTQAEAGIVLRHKHPD
jgi:N-acyl-D-aspartate/D-glutamate deacylase